MAGGNVVRERIHFWSNLTFDVGLYLNNSIASKLLQRLPGLLFMVLGLDPRIQHAASYYLGCLLLGSGSFVIADRGYIKFFCSHVLERVMLGSGIQECSGYGGIAPPESFSIIFSYLNLMGSRCFCFLPGIPSCLLVCFDCLLRPLANH